MINLLKLENLKNSIKRFPISFVLILVITILFFILNNFTSYNSKYEEMLIKSIFASILAFFLSLGIYISTENLKISDLKKSIFQVFPIIFGGIFYYSFNLNSDPTPFILSLVGAIAYVFFAPYISNKIKDKSLLEKLSHKNFNAKGENLFNSIYYQYFYKTAIVFTFGFVLGGLLLALGSLAISATKLLFGLDWVLIEDFYSNWAIISLSLITPIVCLTEIPNKNLTLDEKFELNKFVTFIVKYVLISFTLIYFVIAYAYSLKVLLNFSQWPKGEICWLVIGFSTIGYITYIFSYYFNEKIKIINTFRKAFPFIVIPQIFMLFYAIYLRINQYDLTINRYFVVIFGIWLLVISIYFIFSKKKNLMVIPAILTIFTIIISIGPWSIYSLPEARQTARLKENLEKAKILVDGKIIPLNNYNDIDETLSKEIYEGIEYLCYNTNCENIKEFFSVDANVHIGWEVINEISKKIKVREYNDNKNTFRIQNSGNYFPIEIEGYSKILEVYADEVYADNVNSYDKIENLSTIARINLSDNTLQIIDNGVLQEKINISDLMQEIYSIYNEYGSDLTAEKSIFYLSGEKFDLKLIILSAMLKIPDNNEELVNTYLYMNGFALIKEK